MHQVRSNDGATKALDGACSALLPGDGHLEDRLQAEQEEEDARLRLEDEEARELDDHVHDTVGVVVLDKMGNVAGTVSSGGIALKQPGRSAAHLDGWIETLTSSVPRVGQASCFGCGCWAQKPSRPGTVASTAVSTTGSK